jgi:hypothetical protein
MYAIPPSVMKSLRNNVRLLKSQDNKLRINFKSKMMSTIIKSNFNGQNNSQSIQHEEKEKKH